MVKLEKMATMAFSGYIFFKGMNWLLMRTFFKGAQAKIKKMNFHRNLCESVVVDKKTHQINSLQLRVMYEDNGIIGFQNAIINDTNLVSPYLDGCKIAETVIHGQMYKHPKYLAINENFKFLLEKFTMEQRVNTEFIMSQQEQLQRLYVRYLNENSSYLKHQRYFNTNLKIIKVPDTEKLYTLIVDSSDMPYKDSVKSEVLQKTKIQVPHERLRALYIDDDEQITTKYSSSFFYLVTKQDKNYRIIKLLEKEQTIEYPIDQIMKNKVMIDMRKYQNVEYQEMAVSKQIMEKLLQDGVVTECFQIHKMEMFNIKQVETLIFNENKYEFDNYSSDHIHISRMILGYLKHLMN